MDEHSLEHRQATKKKHKSKQKNNNKNFLHEMAKVKKEPIDGITLALSQALVFSIS